MRLLADFSERRDLPSGPVWPAFGQPGLWLAGPTQVRLAERSGIPLLSLALRRSADPDQGPEPYGILDLTLEPYRNVARAQAVLAEEVPGLPLSLAPVDAVSLSLADGEVAVRGREGRVIEQLSWDKASVLKELLGMGEAPLVLRGSASLRGVSARVPVAAHAEAGFASRLRSALGAAPLTRDTLAFELLSLNLLDALDTVPPADASQLQRLAEALADRIVADWAREAGRNESDLPLYRLNEDLTERVWDLGQPFETVRWLPLDDARLGALHAFVQSHGTSALVSEKPLMRFPRGRHQISVLANLPFDAPDLHFAQVSLVAPPHPPARPAPATASAVFGPGSAEAHAELRLSLGEPLAYTAEASAVIGNGAAMRQLSGSAITQDTALLVLGPEAFGIRALQLSIDPQLSEEAELIVSLRYVHAGLSVAQDIAIESGRRSVLLPLFAEEGAHLVLFARSRDGAQTAETASIPFGVSYLSQSLFPAFGVHDIAVRMDPPPHALAAIEVRRPDAGIETFSFTAASSERSLRHAGLSIFDQGLEWRWMGTDAWQRHAPASGPLVLDPQSAP